MKKHWSRSSTVWAMGATALVAGAVAVLGQRFPGWVPSAVTEAATGAAIAALGAVAFRFRTLTARKSGR